MKREKSRKELDLRESREKRGNERYTGKEAECVKRKKWKRQVTKIIRRIQRITKRRVRPYMRNG